MRAGVVLAVTLAASACSDSGRAGPVGAASLNCSIPESQIFDGGPGKDGIPALTNPQLVGAGESGTEYLRDGDRVIGTVVNGQSIAVPHNIGWWHEIVNFGLGGQRIAVTYCPLTGSSLAFDRSPIDGAELGVSGLLYLNNLIMYDRSTRESLWPQMLRGARCGPRNGTQLPMLPVAEMTWAGWRSLHPDTRVISSQTGISRNYRLYPYGDYEDPDNSQTLFPIPSIDTRRPPKERVLGIPAGEAGGIAFPFGELDGDDPMRVVHASAGGREVVVFWDRERQAAVAHLAQAGGQTFSFEVRDGRIADLQTGSTWEVDGRAVAGPLAGQRLEPVAEAFVAFWFAWAAFHPQTELWQADR